MPYSFMSSFHSFSPFANAWNPFSLEEFDGGVAMAWTLDLNFSMDCLDIVFPSEESILEAMTGIERS